MSTLFLNAKEARLFLLCVGLGAGVGVLYDLLTLSYKGFGQRGRALGEGLFAAAIAVGLFSLLRKSDTMLRSYVILGVCVGWFLYASTVSFFLHGIFRKIRIKKRQNGAADG